MLYFPADLAILSLIGLSCVLTSCIISYLIPLDDDEGHLCVMTALLTATCMILVYLFVSLVFDIIFGVC